MLNQIMLVALRLILHLPQFQIIEKITVLFVNVCVPVSETRVASALPIVLATLAKSKYLLLLDYVVEQLKFEHSKHRLTIKFNCDGEPLFVLKSITPPSTVRSSPTDKSAPSVALPFASKKIPLMLVLHKI